MFILKQVEAIRFSFHEIPLFPIHQAVQQIVDYLTSAAGYSGFYQQIQQGSRFLLLPDC